MGKEVTKVLLLPKTGRRHQVTLTPSLSHLFPYLHVLVSLLLILQQLRVHRADAGHPIGGDYTYCGDGEVSWRRGR